MVTRYVPPITISGPTSVLTVAVLSLMIMIQSSTCVIGFRWLDCVQQKAAPLASSARPQVSCAVNLQTDVNVVVTHSLTAITSFLHSATVLSDSCSVTEKMVPLVQISLTQG